MCSPIRLDNNCKVIFKKWKFYTILKEIAMKMFSVSKISIGRFPPNRNRGKIIVINTTSLSIKISMGQEKKKNAMINSVYNLQLSLKHPSTRLSAKCQLP